MDKHGEGEKFDIRWASAGKTYPVHIPILPARVAKRS